MLLLIATCLFSNNAFAYEAEINGIYYNFNGDEAEVTYTNTSYDFYTGDVVIPESVVYNAKTYSVTSIGSSAFAGCSGLTSVNIPNSVTSIGKYAFNYCSGLASVTIPNSVTSIGNVAFDNCYGLKKVIVPDIAAWCGISFENYNSNPLIYAGHLYSDETTEITNLIIPNSVTSIGDNAFFNCSGLTSVTIPNSVTSIGNGAFSGCSGLTSVTIPNSVKNIGGSAFSYCSGLTSVTIPNSVTSIGSSAFAYCSGLTSVTIPNSVTSIEYGTFRDCSALSSITIPNSITSIGDYAFYNCLGLTSVTIPNSVTNTGNGVFSNCSGLTSVTIGNSVTSIGNYAFSYCSALSSVTIPNSVTSIGDGAFSGCSGLTSVTIPNSVTSIGNYAFRDCSGLTSVTIGSGVLSIGTNAFTSSPKKVIWLTNTPPDGYTNLQGSVNYVANNLYTSLKNVTVYPYLSSLFEVEGVKYVPVSPSERTCDAIDCAYNKSAEHIDIGKTVTNRGITLTVRKINPYTCYGNTFLKDTKLHFKGIIGQQAFYGCSAMQTAELGQEITSIGMEAFSACTKLKGIEIPDAVEFLGSYCFENCSSMTFVKMGNGVKTIPIYSFRGCSSLPTIQIPQNVTNIGNYVFDGCKSLETVLMDDGETELTLGSNGSSPLFASCPLDSVYIGRNINYSIASDKGYSPFYRNTKLRSVTITDKETEISPNEFYGCTALKNVRIGDGVTTFGNWAFSGCSSLDFFAFGSSVETIGKEAFSDCSALTKLISRAAIPPVCGTQALDDINKWECTLLVPDGSLTLYQTADQWKEFFFTEIDPDGIKGVEAEPSPTSEAEYFDLQGRCIGNPQQGVNIIRNTDGTTKKVLMR